MTYRGRNVRRKASAVGDAVLLAVHGAASATTAAATTLAVVAVGREATGGARQLLLVARPLVGAHHRGQDHAVVAIPASGPAVSRTPPAAEPSWHVEPPAGSEEPAGVGPVPRDVGGGARAVLGGFGLLLVNVAASHSGGQQ
ncbi:unnamed protein product [Musa hybrid cultivar]